MALETIYSVGEGRTVVVAVDGCSGCVDAFEQFMRERKQQEDRVVAVVKGGRAATAQCGSAGGKGKFSGPLLLSGTPKVSVRELNGPGLSGKIKCRVRNRVVVPDKPLDDFNDWDRTSRSTLAKLAARAAPLGARFEALRVLGGGKAQSFADAVLECCEELEANLLVVSSHALIPTLSLSPSLMLTSGEREGRRVSPSPSLVPSGRTLCSILSASSSCPVLILEQKLSKAVAEKEPEPDPYSDDSFQSFNPDLLGLWQLAAAMGGCSNEPRVKSFDASVKLGRSLSGRREGNTLQGPVASLSKPKRRQPWVRMFNPARMFTAGSRKRSMRAQ